MNEFEHLSLSYDTTAHNNQLHLKIRFIEHEAQIAWNLILRVCYYQQTSVLQLMVRDRPIHISIICKYIQILINKRQITLSYS